MAQKEYPKIYLYRRVVQAKMFIDRKYSEPLDLEILSGEAAFSKFHFIRLFKKIYGMTPHIYLRQVRMEHAKKHLESGLSVVEACECVGFESIGSFTTLFKKTTGVTPTTYQQHFFIHQQKIISQPIQFVPHCFALAHGWQKKQF